MVSASTNSFLFYDYLHKVFCKTSSNLYCKIKYYISNKYNVSNKYNITSI